MAKLEAAELSLADSDRAASFSGFRHGHRHTYHGGGDGRGVGVVMVMVMVKVTDDWHLSRRVKATAEHNTVCKSGFPPDNLYIQP